MTDSDVRAAVKKVDGDHHLVYGVVYTPLQVDTDMETMTHEDVLKMAHDFLWFGRNAAIDVMHNTKASGAKVVESFIVREGDKDFGDYPGAWVLAVKVPEESQLWEDIKAGTFNGFSFSAQVTKVPKRVIMELVSVSEGKTEDSTATGIPPHSHDFYLEFDDKGRIIFSSTSKVQGHVHPIKYTTATEKVEDHAHRYFVS